MDISTKILDFLALLFFIGASLLGLIRAWMSYNLENAVVGENAISFIRYFLRHLDESVMDITPDHEKYTDKKIEDRRKNLNRITYTIYVFYFLSIMIYLSGQILKK